MIGYIYKLEGGGKVYIGSTTSELKIRLKKHKSKSNERVSKNREVYKHFKQIGWGAASISIIKQVEVFDRRELLNYEKEEVLKIINNDNCLNSILPITTLDEKKQKDSEYSKKRRNDNPEKERLRLQRWRQENPDKRREQVARERLKKILQ